MYGSPFPPLKKLIILRACDSNRKRPQVADGTFLSTDMLMFLCHFLVMGLSLPVAMAMPEAPLQAPSTPPYPPMEGPGRVFDSEGENMTEPPPGDLEAYCQMLLQVPVPPDQVPWFCMCTQCQSTPGPKGDQGDRGLTGTSEVSYTVFFYCRFSVPGSGPRL